MRASSRLARVAVAGDRDDRRVGIAAGRRGAHPADERQAVDRLHHQVGEDDIDFALGDDLQRLDAVAGHEDLADAQRP